MAAVRVFNYMISTNSITPSNIAKGGVQGEHNATQIVFNMDSSLINVLMGLSGADRTFCYRFDGYDGLGVKHLFDVEEFSPSEDRSSFSFLVDNILTRYGGTVQIYLVITLNEADGTEMELYSYAVKLALKSKDKAEDITEGDYNSMSTLAMVAKTNARTAELASVTALEAQEKTELAKAALNGEWIFDGGNASGAVDIDLAVDKEVSGSSENPIANKVIKRYADEIVEASKSIVGTAEGEVWQYNGTTFEKIDTNILWTYEKCPDGIARCWGKLILESGINIGTNYFEGFYYSNRIRVRFPFKINDNVVTVSGGSASHMNFIRTFAHEEEYASFCAVGASKTTNVDLVADINVNGFWGKDEVTDG